MAKKVIISFAVDGELKGGLAALAKADGRSLSSYCDRVLAAHVSAEALRLKKAKKKT